MKILLKFILLLTLSALLTTIYAIHNPKRFKPSIPNFFRWGKLEKTDSEKKVETESDEESKKYIQTLEQNVQILEVIIDKLEKDLEMLEKDRKKKEEFKENRK